MCPFGCHDLFRHGQFSTPQTGGSSPLLFWIVGFRLSALEDKEHSLFDKSSGYCYAERNGREESGERGL